MRRLPLAFCGILLYCVGHFGAARAASIEVLDQHFVVPSNTDTGFDSNWGDLAQTFTVGVDGVLSRVEVLASTQGDALNHDDLSMSIWDVAAGLPGRVLAGTTIPETAFSGMFQPTWVGWDVSSYQIQVQQGDTLAIVLTGAGEKNYSWHGELHGPQYTFGDALKRLRSTGTWEPAIADNEYSLLFRTYNTVPEPSTLVLLGVTAVGLLISATRRRCRVPRTLCRDQ